MGIGSRKRGLGKCRRYVKIPAEKISPFPLLWGRRVGKQLTPETQGAKEVILRNKRPMVTSST